MLRFSILDQLRPENIALLDMKKMSEVVVKVLQELSELRDKVEESVEVKYFKYLLISNFW